MDEPDYSVPFDESWEVIAAVATASHDEPQGAAETLRKLAELGYRVVPAS